MVHEPPLPNKHALLLVLLRSVENGEALTLEEFMRCSEPERQNDKTKGWYRRWLREMKSGGIVTNSGGSTLEESLLEYVNGRIAMFGEQQQEAIDVAIGRL